MSKVWVPPKVEAELAEEMRVKYRAVLWGLFDFDDPVCKRWEPELRKLDPYVRLGRAKPNGYVPGYPVRPGFYHFLRDNPNAPPTVETITGPNDEWIEPDSGLLRKLESNDLLDPRVIVEMEARQEQAKREQEQLKAEQREERQAEIFERWQAGNRTFVSMDQSTPWTQSARARRG